MENFLLYRNIFAPFSFTATMWPVLIVIFFFSVVLHEVAHGYAAYLSGDSTAKTMGRITLNPIPHIDIFGTIIVPFLLFQFGGVIIGWAKPVPINPYNFNNLREDTIKVSISGVLANFSLAIIFSIIIWIMNITRLYSSYTGFMLMALMAAGVSMNIVLGLFNLIPIPPLDGSRIVSMLLPPAMSQKYDSIAPFGIIILFLLIRVLFPVVTNFGNIIYRLLFWGL